MWAIRFCLGIPPSVFGISYFVCCRSWNDLKNFVPWLFSVSSFIIICFTTPCCLLVYHEPFHILMCLGATTRNRTNNLPGSVSVPYPSIFFERNQSTKAWLQCRANCWWVWGKASGRAWLHIGIGFPFFDYFVVAHNIIRQNKCKKMLNHADFGRSTFLDLH